MNSGCCVCDNATLQSRDVVTLKLAGKGGGGGRGRKGRSLVSWCTENESWLKPILAIIHLYSPKVVDDTIMHVELERTKKHIDSRYVTTAVRL